MLVLRSVGISYICILFFSSQGISESLITCEYKWYDWIGKETKNLRVWLAPWSQEDRAQGLLTLYISRQQRWASRRTQVRRGRELGGEGGQRRQEEAVRTHGECFQSLSDSYSQRWPSLGSPGECQTYWCLAPNPEILIWLLCMEPWVRGCLKALQLRWMHSQGSNHWLSRAIC